MQFPTIAIRSIIPNRKVHNVFCSQGISNGRFAGGLKQSESRSLQKIKEDEKKRETIGKQYWLTQTMFALWFIHLANVFAQTPQLTIIVSFVFTFKQSADSLRTAISVQADVFTCLCLKAIFVVRMDIFQVK